jgi:hypothetical protein
MARKIAIDYHNSYRSQSRCHTFLLMLRVLGLILFYWCCSISLTFFNRHLFRDSKFPLSITTLHMAIKWVLAALIRACLHRHHCSKCCPPYQKGDRERVHLTWPILWRKVAPTGDNAARNSVDIALVPDRIHRIVGHQFIELVIAIYHDFTLWSVVKSRRSLSSDKRFTVFLVMCKSTVIIYILVFGIIFGLERFVSRQERETSCLLRNGFL